MQLTLGDQNWEAEGTSIKKAQHTAAAKALEGTKFPKPIVRPFRSEGRNPGITRGPGQVPLQSVSRGIFSMSEFTDLPVLNHGLRTTSGKCVSLAPRTAPFPVVPNPRAPALRAPQAEELVPG